MQDVKILTKSQYDKIDRVATGAIIFENDGEENPTDYVLLVTSLKSPYWVFTKGGAEPHLSYQENAQKECTEEAGIIVAIDEDADPVVDVVMYYPASEGYREKVQREVYFLGEFFEVADEWDEEGLRDVEWHPVNEDLKKIMSPVQYEILEIAYAAYRATQKTKE